MFKRSGKSWHCSRPELIKVKGLDRRKGDINQRGRILARALSHEMDHLDGILFTDKVVKY